MSERCRSGSFAGKNESGGTRFPHPFKPTALDKAPACQWRLAISDPLEQHLPTRMHLPERPPAKSSDRALEPMFRFVGRFLDFSDQEKEIMKDSCFVRSYRKGEWITRSFDETSNGYFLLKGTVVMLRAIEDRELVSEVFFEGEPLVPAVSDSSQGGGHQLKCLEDCELAETPADRMEDSLRNFPRFEVVCRQFAEERLRQSMQWNDKLRLLSPRERYDLALRERPLLAQRVPQYMLASYLGITPETLSRIRRQIATD